MFFSLDLKRNTTSTTSSNASRSVVTTSEMEALTTDTVSRGTEKSMSFGNVFLIRSEEEHHQHHQQQRFQKRRHHFGNGSVDHRHRFQGYGEIDVFRKCFSH